MTYRVEALSDATFPAFEALVRKHNGIFGGCWCLWFHEQGGTGSHEGNCAAKKRLVEQGIAHHALVMNGDAVVGWCEYGTPVELPNIYHRKQYDASGIEPTDYRITCFFVDRDHRKRGVAELALGGALDAIAQAGGGSVEGYPRHDLDTKKMSASFLFNGTLHMFERAGFERVADLAKFRCIVRRTVAQAH
jgi:ribosomal protein S18 acetylase RimI-like enzyme